MTALQALTDIRSGKTTLESVLPLLSNLDKEIVRNMIPDSFGTKNKKIRQRRRLMNTRRR